MQYSGTIYCSCCDIKYVGVKMCPKNVIKNRYPRCASVTHDTPILKIWDLCSENSLMWREYGPKIITNQGTHFNTWPLYSARKKSCSCPKVVNERIFGMVYSFLP